MIGQISVAQKKRGRPAGRPLSHAGWSALLRAILVAIFAALFAGLAVLAALLLLLLAALFFLALRRRFLLVLVGVVSHFPSPCSRTMRSCRDPLETRGGGPCSRRGPLIAGAWRF